ncbi:MAG: 4-phosphoerythronate dehydrogenase [Bacteroidales bacterium]|nr:4-phosphoerythronate dehydrogenase [Bacteroidales bacterium]
MKLIIDDKIPFIRGEAERLGEAVYLPGSAITAADVREADALIVRTRTRCDRLLLEGSRVGFVATATIGFDHIDTDYLHEAGIGWTNCPGCNAASVAQYVESALLLLAREGKVKLSAETTLGIVGVGHVGTQVALMARRLGLRLLLCDPLRLAGRGGVCDGEPAAGGIRDAECTATLADICREADIISFHTPLTRQGEHATFHLAGADFFGALARRPVVFNSSRGEVVDTPALLAALKAGRVSEAVVDTWENEPDIDRELLAAAFLATPHIAGYSADGKANGTRMALEAVARHFGIKADFNICPPHVERSFRYYPSAPDNAAETDPRLALYDPRRDSDALRARPEDFERLRGNYPLRRERFD